MSRVVALILALAGTAIAETPKPKPKATKATASAKAWIATMITGKDLVSASKDKPLKYWILGNVESCAKMFDGASATKPAELRKIKQCVQDQTKGRSLDEQSVEEISLSEALGTLPKYLRKKMTAAAKGTTIVKTEFDGDDGFVGINLAVAADGSVRVLWIQTPSVD